MLEVSTSLVTNHHGLGGPGLLKSRIDLSLALNPHTNYISTYLLEKDFTTLEEKGKKGKGKKKVESLKPRLRKPCVSKLISLGLGPFRSAVSTKSSDPVPTRRTNADLSNENQIAT